MSEQKTLVDALRNLSAEWRESSGLAEAFDTGRHYCADELDALMATHWRPTMESALVDYQRIAEAHYSREAAQGDR